MFRCLERIQAVLQEAPHNIPDSIRGVKRGQSSSLGNFLRCLFHVLAILCLVFQDEKA